MLDIIINIAKKEFIDNIRNKWIIIITILFISLTLLASYAGSIYSEGWQDLGSTMSVMGGLVNFLITIIALILGYSAIIGEIEKGSMDSLLSLPAKKNRDNFREVFWVRDSTYFCNTHRVWYCRYYNRV